MAIKINRRTKEKKSKLKQLKELFNIPEKKVTLEEHMRRQAQPIVPPVLDKPKPPQTGVTQPEVLTKEGTGKQAGITLPGETPGQKYFGPQGEITREQYMAMGGTPGRTFLGLSPKDVAGVAAGEAAKTEMPFGAISAQEGAAIREQQLLAGQVGITGQAGPGVIPQLSQRQALQSAFSLALAGAIGGAAVGAAGGAVVGGIGAIPGAIGGAIVGAVGSFLTAYRGNLKAQQAGELTAKKTEARQLVTNMRNAVTVTNTDPGTMLENLEYFNTNYMLMRQKYADLQAMKYDDKARWLGEDTTKEMVRYELFFMKDGTGDILITQMKAAMVAPDPNKILLSVNELMGETE